MAKNSSTAHWPVFAAALCALIVAMSTAYGADAPATQPAVAGPAAERPAGRTKDCTSGGCHAGQKNYKVQHGPTAVNACDACHGYVDENKHTFKLKEQKEALCTFCHIGGGGGVGQVVHKPFAQGDCLGCHNPHGGTNRALLRKDDMASLCASCHGDVTQHRKYLHGPVASGSCAACHSSHRAPFPKLLAAQGRDLCLTCHDTMAGQLKQVKVVHKPVDGDCQQCHEVHASDIKMHLKKQPVDLCTSCHESVQKQVASAAYKHSAVTSGDACLSCHTAHGSDLARLMKTETAKACLTCHDKAIKVAGDRVVASMSAVMDTSQNKHGPIRDGDCSGCHTPHGGSVARLLTKPYPDTFYQAFDLEKYGLCFSCHDKQLVLLSKTTGLTKFRNGDENLHYVHVNKADKGRNCRACHSTHTSTQPMHLRETVPYGKWEMPINFKQTSAGGGCKPGCHEELTYDREKPVQYRPTSTTAARNGSTPLAKDNGK